jgi:hypothetical protein
MGRKPESDDVELAAVLWTEISGNFAFWLSNQNSELSRRAILKLDAEFQRAPTVPAKTYGEGQRLAQVAWIVRRVLTPGASDGIFPAKQARRVRTRLLSKVRETRRRGGPNSRTVRFDADVARDLDQLAEAWGCKTRPDVVDRLVRNALAKLLADSPA